MGCAVDEPPPSCHPACCRPAAPLSCPFVAAGGLPDGSHQLLFVGLGVHLVGCRAVHHCSPVPPAGCLPCLRLAGVHAQLLGRCARVEPMLHPLRCTTPLTSPCTLQHALPVRQPAVCADSDGTARHSGVHTGEHACGGALACLPGEASAAAESQTAARLRGPLQELRRREWCCCCCC